MNGLHREAPAHALEGQNIERQVDDKEHGAERQPGHVEDEKGEPGGAAGQQASELEQRQREGDEHCAGDDRQHVLGEAVARRLTIVGVGQFSRSAK